MGPIFERDAFFEVIESKSVLRPTKTGRPLPVPSLTNAEELGLYFTLLRMIANDYSKRYQDIVVSEIIANANGAAVASSETPFTSNQARCNNK